MILGPSNEPHGPLYYPQGCQLFSAFQGSYFHSEVETLAAEKQYRLVQAARFRGPPRARASETKRSSITAADGSCSRRPARRPEHASTSPGMLAAIVVEGEVGIEDERLGAWDFFYVAEIEQVPFGSRRARRS